MPDITIRLTVDQAQRVAASLADTPYPQTASGIKAWLSDYIRSHVREYERAKATASAVAALSEPQDITPA